MKIFPNWNEEHQIQEPINVNYFHHFTEGERVGQILARYLQELRRKPMPTVSSTTFGVVPQNYLFPTPVTRTADELCDDLLDHMLECTVCLNGEESSCATWQELQNEIKAAGKPHRGMLLAI